MSQTSDFNISIRSINNHWRKIVLFMVIGGLLGLFVALILPPRYLATGVVDVGIDFNRTLSLSRIAQEHALERVRALLVSDEVMDATILVIQERNPAIEIDGIGDLRSRLQLGEIGSQWMLSAKDGDPGTAVIIAGSWVDVSLDAIDSALGAALRTAEIQNDYYGLGCRLISIPETEMAVWQCQETEEDPSQIEAAFREEAARSHGLLPAMSFNLISDVGESVSKVTDGGGTLTIMGIFTGLIVSLWSILYKNS